MAHITSIKDERIVEARALASAAGRRERGKCLLEGKQIIAWALDAGVPVERVFFAEQGDHPLMARLAAAGVECFAVTDGVLKKITGRSYVVPFIGVARPGTLPGEPGDFVIVLDGVQDFGNIGTIVRTAKAFGVRDLTATAPDFDLYHRKTIEASRGKVFEVRLSRFGSPAEAVEHLKRRGFQIVATSPYGRALQSAAQLQPRPVALVVGNETAGASDAVMQSADLVVQIPMRGQVESLNVGVATGISVYELKFKLVMAMLTQYIRSTLGREVNVAGKLIQRALDARLHAVTQFDSSQVVLLMVLACDETMTLEQVSKDTAAFDDELRALLDPLFEAGHIERVTPEAIRLTAGGERFLAQIWNVIEAAEDDVFAGFADAEKQRFLEDLRRIQANCIHIIDEAGE
jgi:TrmH family RNA methyltransferase